MAERLLILGVFLAALLVAWRLWQRRALGRRDPAGLGAVGYRPGLPAILYFTAPGCAPCESVQKPALAQLAEAFEGRLQILEIDAAQEPRLADGWGVLAVPTTFVIDRAGRPRRVNHGPTRAPELLAQLAEIGEAVAGLQSNPAPPAVTPRLAGPDEGSRHGTIARPG